MNKFEVQGSGFPADNRTWRFIRDMINQVHELTALGGENYILKGCENENGTIADGFIVLNGELLPFQGGALATKITIDETVDAVTYLEDINPTDGQGDIKDAYFTRFARFGTNGVATYNWADLERIDPLTVMQRKLVPKYSILMWPYMEDDPLHPLPWGYYLCDGQNGTFNIPSGYTPVNVDPSDSNLNQVGKQFGTKMHTLTEAQMPRHNHSGNVVIPPHSHTYQKSIKGRGYKTKRDDNPHGGYQNAQTSRSASQTATLTTNNKGSNQAHNNMQPSVAVRFIQFMGV